MLIASSKLIFASNKLMHLNIVLLKINYGFIEWIGIYNWNKFHSRSLQMILTFCQSNWLQLLKRWKIRERVAIKLSIKISSQINLIS